jgi:hypothetical protein
MKKKVSAESWSVMTTPEIRDLDAPYLPTGVDLKPEVHPRTEILLNAARRLVSALGTKSRASIMPSNQEPDNDTHISSVEEPEDSDE